MPTPLCTIDDLWAVIPSARRDFQDQNRGKSTLDTQALDELIVETSEEMLHMLRPRFNLTLILALAAVPFSIRKATAVLVGIKYYNRYPALTSPDDSRQDDLSGAWNRWQYSISGGTMQADDGTLLPLVDHPQTISQENDVNSQIEELFSRGPRRY